MSSKEVTAINNKTNFHFLSKFSFRYSHSAEVQVRLQFLTCVFSTLGSPDHFSEYFKLSYHKTTQSKAKILLNNPCQLNMLF